MTAFKIGLSKQAILAIALLLSSLSLLLCTSFAASGGRMGGDSLSNRKRSSSSSFHGSSSSNYRYHHHHHRNWNQGYSSSASKDQKDNDGFPTRSAVIIFCGILAVFCHFYFRAKQAESSLIMVQVGLTGKASSLQRRLNEIAKITNTGSSKGWKFILAETTVALLQHRHFFISGHSSVKQHGTLESLEENFREISREEREKVDGESLVNVNNFRSQTEVVPKSSKLDKDYLVVTILIAVKGCRRVAAIRSIDGLKEVLQSLNFASDELLAVEVLWTPQDENDTLSEENLLGDYPLLRPI